MNENLTPHESQNDAQPHDARVLADFGSAPRAEQLAPVRLASDDNFRAAPPAPLAEDENSVPIFAAPSALPAPASADFAASRVAPFSSSQNDAAPMSQNDAAPIESDSDASDDFARNAALQDENIESTTAQNADVLKSASPSSAEDETRENTLPRAAPPDFPRAERAEDAASTRNARGGVAALIGNISPRILTALVGIPLVLLVVWQGGALLTGITVLLALTAMRELIVAARKNKTPLVIEWCYFLLLFAMIALWNTMPLWREISGDSYVPPPYVEALPSLLHLAWPLLALLLVPVWLLLWGVIRFAKQRVSLASIALSTLAIFYVALFSFWPMLRDLPSGFALFVLLLGGVWAGDSAAYFAGRAFGKTRLTPLSPGKTREGILASCVATPLICPLLALALNFDFWHSIMIGLLISVFAPLGDLIESLWKRELNIKDLGAILPGHGGVLDRCDSLLLTAPIVFTYALWQAL